MGFLGLFKSGKKAGNPLAEPEFLKKIDLSAAGQDEVASAGESTGRSDAPAVTDDVEPELALWLSNGLTARNLKELAVALKKMSVKEYKEYANSQSNEIAGWLQEILNEENLAVRLRKAKNKIQATKLVEKASRMQRPARIAAIKASQKTENAKEKRKISSRGRSGATEAIKKEREEELELDLPKLPELPPMPMEVEKTPQETPAGKPKSPKPRLSLWPFSKRKEQETQIAPNQPTEAGEMSLPLPGIPELPEQQLNEPSAEAKPAKKSRITKIPAREKASKKQKAKAISEAPRPFPAAQNEKVLLEAEAAKPPLRIGFADAETLPEFPEEGDLPSENLEIPQLAESLGLPATKSFKAKPEKEPKRFLFFGRKHKPKEEKPAEYVFNYESIPELKTRKAARANKLAELPKKRTFGTYLQRKAHNAGPIPEAALAEEFAEAFEPEPQHAKWEDSSLIEELPATEEEKIKKLPATKAERRNKTVIIGMDEQDQWKPDIKEHSPLDRQAKELERAEQMLSREEEELNTRRLELTRKRYELIKQKGELEKRKFEEFMEQHKLAPQNKEIVRKPSPEHVIAAFREPEQPDAQLKGMPDFRLAGAYGKERLEELLEQAKENISGNNIEAAKRALDEVQSVFNTVYMTTSEKKHIEYEILEVEADLKLATLK